MWCLRLRERAGWYFAGLTGGRSVAGVNPQLSGEAYGLAWAAVERDYDRAQARVA